eukprot:CAMPEP_0196598802 /NCGR_PEP_ID=MMETSP1081-20130531/94516_1 /TAXON_ID=36882 /ORGANISM="Pyramimonas amylifera, Strain CCMP720" /LENGTH=377 /DNA_ID=CAMNT_0041924525 /DNA_START=181 /DNA_END=1314 /DNA_ORIENTATION=-
MALFSVPKIGKLSHKGRINGSWSRPNLKVPSLPTSSSASSASSHSDPLQSVRVTSLSDSPLLCKSNRSQDKFLFKVWRVLENAPPLRLRVAGELSQDTDKGGLLPEALILNRELFVDRAGHWVRNLKSGAEEELDLPVTLDFPTKMVPLLPPSDRSWRFPTCALVGNSGSLLDKDYGSQIDSRDAVFRINMAPTKGFEIQVGNVTTFDIVNQQHTKVLAGVEGQGGSLPKSEVEDRNSTLVVFEVHGNFARRHLYVPLLERQQAEGRGVLILSPALSVHTHRAWIRFGQALEAAKLFTARKMLKPMSGMFAMMFAHQVCEHIHLYGFSPYTLDSTYPYHYFDKIPGVTKHHRFDAAYEVFKQISKWPCAEGRLSIHN